MADKYNSDDMKDLLDKGQAMKNANGDPSYPVADQEDIENAIKAVGRGGADHDAIRLHIIQGAAKLGLSKLIPDTWNTKDGSLTTDTESKSRVVPATKEARADAAQSFGDIESKVYEALIGSMKSFSDPYPDCWVMDLGVDWVVFQSYDPHPFGPAGLWKLSYAIDADGLVTFSGDPVRVDQVTSFVPVEMNNGRGPAELRADDMVNCPTCKGKGTILDGNRDCPDCADGKVTADKAAKMTETKSAHIPSRSRRRPLQHARRSLDRLPETRQVATGFERRVEQDGDDLILVGTPIVYDTPYDVRDMLGTFRETMKPGVARDVLSAGADVRFLTNHEGEPYARTASGTLVLTDTPTGLRSEAHLDGRQQSAYDLACKVERGDISQMSIGFCVANDGDEWRWGNDGTEEREVLAFSELLDVSAVTYPASPTTSIALAQRMLARAGTESRERIRRVFELGGSLRSGQVLAAKDADALRSAAEALYTAAGSAVPIEARLDAYTRATDAMVKALRAGKVLSSDNQSDLEAALEALHAADDIDIPGITAQLETIDKALDAGQAGLAAVLGRANPDGDANDKNPTLVPAGSAASDADARARQRQRLMLIA
jgi:HK97 family phage prohead protease